MNELVVIFFEKGILAIVILIVGYRITKTIEKIKREESFKNEITKIRIEKITKFYDMFSKYEHWVNRLIINAFHQKENNELYLTEEEFRIATEKANEISKNIGFELNQMRFWINDDIYYHTVAQLNLFREIKTELLLNNNFLSIPEYRLKLDALRMNMDKIIPYLKSNQNLKIVNYDRSFMYKKSPNKV